MCNECDEQMKRVLNQMDVNLFRGDHYSVMMRDNATGEVRTLPQVESRWDKRSYVWWTEGNFSCDCNRAIVFYDTAIDEVECGEGRFELIAFVFGNNKIELPQSCPKPD